MNTTPSSNDWRRQGQERFLKERHLVFRTYAPLQVGWDHDHCEFCRKKFSTTMGDLTEGYTTDDAYHWICKGCFEDFKEEFGWTTEK